MVKYHQRYLFLLEMEVLQLSFNKIELTENKNDLVKRFSKIYKKQNQYD